ncbi:hypothetical protein [Pseudarthrobacter sp. LMD1-1-1.1]|uniref:hypothetical protein n=1 Tax=Pseudarthrobacter sp. LMD1-1-1.1 TaxID=3135242 RepID=UPI00341F0017
MPQIVQEAGTATTGTGARLMIQIINEGQGSSGFYSADVLEQAATDKVFNAGTLMFADHPTESEDWQRPERSIKDLVGVLATDAVFENGALIAEANIFSSWREQINDMKDTIGVSIRAGAEVAIEDNGGGPVQVIKRLTHAASVDFVTMAGRGGAILEVLESARDVDLVTAPKDSAPNPAAVTENQEEATMATIDDKELAALRESASRATTAEADITTATERATRAETALTRANDTAAAAVVEAAFTAAGITAPKTAARLSKGYPVDESGALNTEALAAEIAESIAELQVANGAGTVRGVGHTSGVKEAVDVADADVLTALKGA